MKIKKKLNITREKKQLSISVVIPIYNSEQYLDDCLNSIKNQTIDLDNIEVICIDDGSTDNSLYICNKYKTAIKNITIYKTKHRGVSAARNIGIKKAQGNYIIFLDSDDMLGQTTIERLELFFKQHHSETDIITYDIYYMNGKKITVGRRGGLIKKDTILDINEFPYICQTTMNICIKNNKKHYFDEIKEHGEDQCFIINVLKNKKTIGYCSECKYIYRQHPKSIASKIDHPFFNFEKIIYIFESLINDPANKNIIKYINNIILYNLEWRLSADLLFPYHYKKNKYDIAEKRINHLIDKIDNDIIINSPWISEPHKHFFLTRKKTNIPFSIIDYNRWWICDNNGELFHGKDILCVIHRCFIKNGQINIIGFFKSPVLNYIEKPKCNIVLNDNSIIEQELYKSSWSCWETKIKTNNFWGFSIQIDLKINRKFFLFITIEDKKFNLSYYFRNMSQISTERNNYHVFSSSFCVHFKNNSFYILNLNGINEALRAECYNAFINYYNQNKELKEKSLKKYNSIRIWLYSDSKDVFDNAYYQFKHDLLIDDGILKIYIYNGDEKNICMLFNDSEKKYIVNFNSMTHKMLFLCSEKIFTSFSEERCFMPFSHQDIQSYLDIIKFDVIYLQHGIMHGKIKNLYANDMNYFINKIIISTEMEKTVAITDLNYLENNILSFGMPRFDRIKSINNPEKKIIFAPSWRNYLVYFDSYSGWNLKNGFEESIYFNKIYDFLNNQALQNSLEKNNISLDFKLHPIMRMYDNYFINIHKNINLVSSAQVSDYKLCITDFSSYFYDFIYAEKPVLFFIPDREMIDAGLHTYREFYIELENSFGKYTETVNELVFNIIECIKNDFKIDEKIKYKYNNFFIHKDNKNSSRIYDYCYNN